MPENDEQSKDNDQSGQQKTFGEVEDSLPLNETPPPPTDKMTDADFAEGSEEIFVFVQAEGSNSSDEEE